MALLAPPVAVLMPGPWRQALRRSQESPRFPFKGSVKRDPYVGIDIDMDIDSTMAVY